MSQQWPERLCFSFDVGDGGGDCITALVDRLRDITAGAYCFVSFLFWLKMVTLVVYSLEQS